MSISETTTMQTNQKTASMRSTLWAMLLILLLSTVGHAQTYSLAPSAFQVFLDNNGLIVNGGCVWTYTAGTTTPVTTYSDSAGTPNTNPIKADSSGRFAIYLQPGMNYKFVYENVPCDSPSTHGSVLRTADNVGAVASQSPLRARGYHSTTQAVADSTYVAVLLDSEDYDVGGLHSTSSLTSRFTVPTGGDGTYLMTASVLFAANATGQRVLLFRKNGADLAAGGTGVLPGSAATPTEMSATTALPLVAGDYIEAWVYQSSGGSLNIGNAVSNFFQNAVVVLKVQ